MFPSGVVLGWMTYGHDVEPRPLLPSKFVDSNTSADQISTSVSWVYVDGSRIDQDTCMTFVVIGGVWDRRGGPGHLPVDIILPMAV